MLRAIFKTCTQSLKVPKQCLNKNCIRHLRKRTLYNQIPRQVLPFLTHKLLFTEYNTTALKNDGALKNFRRTLITTSPFRMNQAEQDIKKEAQKTSILSSMYGDSYQGQNQHEKQNGKEEIHKVSFLYCVFFVTVCSIT